MAFAKKSERKLNLLKDTVVFEMAPVTYVSKLKESDETKIQFAVDTEDEQHITYFNDTTKAVQLVFLSEGKIKVCHLPPCGKVRFMKLERGVYYQFGNIEYEFEVADKEYHVPDSLMDGNEKKITVSNNTNQTCAVYFGTRHVADLPAGCELRISYYGSVEHLNFMVFDRRTFD
jgi:hypothetical protein